MTGPGQSLPPVSVTGVGVAALRAEEASRDDRLFDDPYAATFVRAAAFEPRRAGNGVARLALAAWITARTRFLDDLLLDACAQGCRQIVILGAGLDARAFRLPWPEGTRLWELDLGDVRTFKERVIAAEGWQPACKRISVPADLSEDWQPALVDTGFDAAAPVAWLAEGLLAYLTLEANDALLARTAALSVVGSRFGLTIARPERLERWRQDHPDARTGSERSDSYVSLWNSTAPSDPEPWLASFGWRGTFFAAVERLAAYGRPWQTSAGSTSSWNGLVDAVRV